MQYLDEEYETKSFFLFFVLLFLFSSFFSIFRMVGFEVDCNDGKGVPEACQERSFSSFISFD